jgi:hypothetical protein
MRTRTLLPLVAILAVGAFAASAQASQISFEDNGTTLVYTADPGEANTGAVYVDTTDYACQPFQAPCMEIQDAGTSQVTLHTDQCVVNPQIFGSDVVCQLPQLVRANLGDLADSWFDWNGPSVIDGGPGDDNTINGNGGDDVIHGGIGNDVLVGGPGNDTLDGGPGDDDLEGIPGDFDTSGAASLGTDTYIGGGGGDIVDYAGRTEDLSLSLDGIANDGAPGENDNIGADINGVEGGDGNDTIAGNAGPDYLNGGTGNDTITGGGGDDRLFGGSGNDQLDAGPGQDYLEGDVGDDVLIGGPDVDTFYGEDPTCTSLSCTGRDQIFARDGLAEPVDCGPGIDAAHVDTIDVLYSYPASDDQCENVDAAGPAAGGGAGGGNPGGGAGGGNPGGGAGGGNPGGGAGGGAPGGAGGGNQGGGAGGGTPGGGRVPAKPLAVAKLTVDHAGRIVIPVTVPAAGVVRTRATARNGHRTITVANTHQTANAALKLRLLVNPSATARAALRRRHHLTVALRITFTPTSGGTASTITRTLTLRAPQ